MQIGQVAAQRPETLTRNWWTLWQHYSANAPSLRMTRHGAMHMTRSVQLVADKSTAVNDAMQLATR